MLAQIAMLSPAAQVAAVVMLGLIACLMVMFFLLLALRM